MSAVENVEGNAEACRK